MLICRMQETVPRNEGTVSEEHSASARLMLIGVRTVRYEQSEGHGDRASYPKNEDS